MSSLAKSMPLSFISFRITGLDSSVFMPAYLPAYSVWRPWSSTGTTMSMP